MTSKSKVIRPNLRRTAKGGVWLKVGLEYVSKYATKDAADEAGEDEDSESEMSSVGEFDSGDEEPAGQMEV